MSDDTKKPLAARDLFAKKPWPKPKKAKDFPKKKKKKKDKKKLIKKLMSRTGR